MRKIVALIYSSIKAFECKIRNPSSECFCFLGIFHFLANIIDLKCNPAKIDLIYGTVKTGRWFY
jgi:hypothetical protein